MQLLAGGLDHLELAGRGQRRELGGHALDGSACDVDASLQRKEALLVHPHEVRAGRDAERPGERQHAALAAVDRHSGARWPVRDLDGAEQALEPRDALCREGNIALRQAGQIAEPREHLERFVVAQQQLQADRGVLRCRAGRIERERLAVLGQRRIPGALSLEAHGLVEVRAGSFLVAGSIFGGLRRRGVDAQRGHRNGTRYGACPPSPAIVHGDRGFLPWASSKSVSIVPVGGGAAAAEDAAGGGATGSLWPLSGALADLRAFTSSEAGCGPFSVMTTSVSVMASPFVRRTW
jgi:hypothetical protein